MLVQIGQRSRPTDIVDLLYDCHARIRRFLVLARGLATSSGRAESEIREIAEQIIRYFTTAFPLHIADEEESILPRLKGRTASLDIELAQMRADHREHDGLDRLVAICRGLAREPRQLAARAGDLAATTAHLALHLEPHLTAEERTIFPALRDLPADELRALHAEMRLRRDVALRAP